MLRLGLTGGIAAGKSSVAAILAQKGAQVVDADKLAHETYAPGGPGYAAVLKVFGEDILAPDRSVDRARLAAHVFHDERLMDALTAIVWPHTRDLVQERARAAEATGAALFAVEAALLLEAGWRDYFDHVWYVRSPAEAVRTRLQERGLSAPDAEARLSSRSEPARLADEVDAVIENDGDLEGLRARVDALWLTLAVE